MQNSKRDVTARYNAKFAIIESLDQQIAAEEAKLNRDVASERAQTERKIQDLQTKVDEALASMDSMKERQLALEQERASAKEQLGQGQARVERIKGALRGAQGRLHMLNNGERDPYSAFTVKMSAVVRAINENRGWREKPIGPLGRCIKLKDDKYATIVDAFFGESLNAFIVQNNEDRDALFRIMQRVG